jgi:hypothetical protein
VRSVRVRHRVSVHGRLGLLVAFLVAGCGGTPPPGSPEMGTIRVTMQGVADRNGLLSSENRGRVVDADGVVAAEWKLSVDSAAPVRVPVGTYTLSAYTVFFSDSIQCVDDAFRPSLQSCFQVELPGQVCGVPIELTASGGVDAVFTILTNGRCRLEPLPPAVPMPTG